VTARVGPAARPPQELAHPQLEPAPVEGQGDRGVGRDGPSVDRLRRLGVARELDRGARRGGGAPRRARGRAQSPRSRSSVSASASRPHPTAASTRVAGDEHPPRRVRVRAVGKRGEPLERRLVAAAPEVEEREGAVCRLRREALRVRRRPVERLAGERRGLLLAAAHGGLPREQGAALGGRGGLAALAGQRETVGGVRAGQREAALDQLDVASTWRAKATVPTAPRSRASPIARPSARPPAARSPM
jgi:hypothetical protein